MKLLLLIPLLITGCAYITHPVSYNETPEHAKDPPLGYRTK